MQPAPRNLLFIVGAPRSGTKLLRHLLNNHSRIALTTNETEFLPYLVAFCANARLSTEAGFRRFAAYLRLEDYVFHRRSERGAEVDFEGWRAAVRSDCPADAFRAFMQLETAPNALTTIIGDKSPRYTRCLPMIFQHFPEARVVHIVRDPRRQAGSLRRVFGKRISQSAAAWQATVDAVAAGQSSHPERIFELSYEALTAEPEATLRGLCDFLGLEFEPGMLVVERNIERGGKATTGLGPAGRVALFDDLSMQDIALVENLAARGMAAHGYTPLAPPIPRRAAPQFRALSRLGGLVGLGTKVLARDGVGALVRKLRLVRARRMILAGRW